MDTSDIRLFSMVKQRMKYLSARQTVLAQNIANANTPGYKAKEVVKPDFSKMVSEAGNTLPMAKTHHSHQAGALPAHRFKVAQDMETFETKPDGNNVSIDEQMMKVSENNADYQETVSIYRKMQEMMRLATGQGNR